MSGLKGPDEAHRHVSYTVVSLLAGPGLLLHGHVVAGRRHARVGRRRVPAGQLLRLVLLVASLHCFSVFSGGASSCGRLAGAGALFGLGRARLEWWSSGLCSFRLRRYWHRSLVGLLDALGDVAVYPLVVPLDPLSSDLGRLHGLEESVAAHGGVGASGPRRAVGLRVPALWAPCRVAVGFEVALINSHPPNGRRGRHGYGLVPCQSGVVETGLRCRSLVEGPRCRRQLRCRISAPALLDRPPSQGSGHLDAVRVADDVGVGVTVVAQEDPVGPQRAHVAVGLTVWTLTGEFVEDLLGETDQSLVEWAASGAHPSA